MSADDAGRNVVAPTTARTTATVAALNAAARYEPSVADGFAVMVRPIEDAALRAVDRASAQSLVAIDRRYDRRLRELRLELVRREEADGPDYPGGRSREALDGWGFVLAIVGAAIVLGTRSSAGSIDAVVVSWSAVLLVGVAVAIHAVSAVVDRHGHPSRSAPGYLAFTAAAAFASAAVLAGWPDAGAPLGPFAIVLVLEGCLALVLMVRAGLRALALARRVRDYDRGMAELRAPLEAEAAALGAEALADAAAVLEAMDPEPRSDFEAARRAGLDAVTASASPAPATARRLRSAEPFALRYAEQV